MAKTPRSRNSDDMVIQGKELDAYIEAELQAMVREGLEKSPIQASTLHARLKAKGIIKGGLSTLSSRRDIINKYKLRQHNNHDDGKRELTADEKAMLAQGRTGAAYINKADRLDNELQDYKERYERNILAVTDIIEYVDSQTAIRVEDMLADHLIRELAERKRSGK
ncbi:hypothetical protein PDPUS_2_00736 [Photobacterium damselae subsp. piscicida]|uniref:Uncharacterized protein n=1 Tax=Photobacterium damsela subsp. piscicida TaxID=38294 RepID=A0A1V1VE93_PHODP|nr:hypothetical protein [Photobacterium damselae]MBE8127101.1 hypothetical protein [Photobacterium damselae subsp. piscicida]PSV71146.1 hypothetical protein CTT35_10720 [Photobacterium damselae]PSW77273.1 hypothetical protein CTT37_11390 [Photobacterium damselae]QOD54147.1 hypothetical protein IC628_19005 [Photobacterium damselae subsp. piscicida]QOD58364.1 hypothetical protein IC627_15725 [Photobacterium damselae subsp. piscicida]